MAIGAGGAAKVAGGGADVAQGLKTGSAAAEAARGGSKGFKLGDEVLDLSQMGNDDLVKFLDDANADDLVAALNGIDSKKLATIGENLNPATIDTLRTVEGGADLAKKLDPSSAKKLTLTQRAKNSATAFSKAFSAKLNKATKSIKKTRSTAQNPPNNINDVIEGSENGVKNLPPGKNVNNAGTDDVSGSLSKQTVSPEANMGEAVKDTTKVLEDGSKSSKSLKKALGELGITPGSVAIGAGVIVLLCMAYDTDNPFTAVDRALDDTGKVVKGFKEVADSAATAAKDVTTGGFDFISFVTNNSWISFSCSILCVILLFALFTMGMLGSMGGNNKR